MALKTRQRFKAVRRSASLVFDGYGTKFEGT
jgi:hypothetical protein